MCLAFMALMGVMITLPLFLQSVSGMTPLTTGLLLMPGGLVMGLLGPRVGSLFDQYGARVLVVPGSALLLGVLAAFATIFTPVFTTGLGALPPHLYPHGSAVLGTLQQVAAAIGTAVVVTILSVGSASLATTSSDPVSGLS